MDLRPYKLSKSQVEEAIGYIQKFLLCYQPYIISDVLEVGEGQNFHDGYDRKTIYGRNIYSAYDIGLSKSYPLAENLEHFRACNTDYRRIYEAFSDQIVNYFKDDIKKMVFSEIGTNSGLHLFNLALRGAKHCIGFDWNNMGELFSWLNKILGTNVEFHNAVWNRLYHRLDFYDHPEVDMMISSVVLNHQVDFMAHLAYICDRSKRALFLWVLTEKNEEKDCIDAAWNYVASKEYFISFCSPNALHPVSQKDWEGNPFPLCFDQGICMSDSLLRASLSILGFEKIICLEYPKIGLGWGPFCKGFKPYLAIRTRDAKSAYWETK